MGKVIKFPNKLSPEQRWRQTFAWYWSNLLVDCRGTNFLITWDSVYEKDSLAQGMRIRVVGNG